MNYINKIPKFQRKKAIPKQLKDLELLPLNEQFSKLTMPILSDDDMRPVMTGNFFDMENKKIVSTDAHSLTLINMPNETYNFIKETYSKELDKEPRGLIFHTLSQLQKDYNSLMKVATKNDNDDFQTFDEYVKFRAIEDGRYPNYEAIIPIEFKRNINIDYQKLYWYSKVLLDAKVIDDLTKINNSNENEYQNKKIEYLKDSYDSFLPYTNQIILTYTLDSKKEFIGFNAKFLCEILKFAMEFNGKYFGKIGINENTRPMAIELENELNTKTNSIGLVSPVMLFPTYNDTNDETMYLIGNNNNFFDNYRMYYDLDTNSIVSGDAIETLQNYPIDEEIGFIPLKTDLSTPKIRVKEQVTKVGSNPSEFNVGDIIEDNRGVVFEVKNPKTKENLSQLINKSDRYRKDDIEEWANTESTKIFTLSMRKNEVKTLTIDDRIKGLKIVLKLAKGDNKALIEKRIKGLEIVKKMSSPKVSVAGDYGYYNDYSKEEIDAIEKKYGTESEEYSAITLPKTFDWKNADEIGVQDPNELKIQGNDWLDEQGIDKKKFGIAKSSNYGRNSKMLDNLIGLDDEGYYVVLYLYEKGTGKKTSVADKSKINTPKNYLQTAKKLAEKLMNIKDEVFDSLNINSGSELYGDIEIQKKFVDAMKVKIDQKRMGIKDNANLKEYLNLFGEDIFNILEDNNYHSLNNFLVLGKYIIYPKQYDYYVNSAIEYPKSSLQTFDTEN